MNKIKLKYHKRKLKQCLLKHRSFRQSLSCGYGLAKYFSSDLFRIEQQADKHIKMINKLDNKKFKTFRDGYIPVGTIM